MLSVSEKKDVKRNRYPHNYILCKWTIRNHFVYGSTTSPHFLTQECEPCNISTIILREEGLNTLASFVQEPWETRHIFEAGFRPGSNLKAIQSEGFILCSPGRKLKSFGVVICSEAINSWGCFAPQTSWIFPGSTISQQMWWELGNSMWPQNT